MAKYGTKMLEKIVFQYCPKDGSSSGMRNFLMDVLPAFKSNNEQLDIQAIAKQHRHPKAIGFYRNGRAKPIDVKNLSAQQIEEHVLWLRSSHGRDQDYKVTRSRHLSRNPSIQGMWTVDTFAAQLERRNGLRRGLCSSV